MGALGIGAGLVGLIRGSDKATISAQQDALSKIDSLEVPDEDKLTYKLEYLKNVGSLTPEMEQAIQQQDTQLNNVKVDPQQKAAQMEALSRLEQTGKQGLNLDEKSAANELTRQQDAENQRQNAAIQSNLAARGQLGSGQELALKLAASQNSADSANKSASDLARLMASRKLDSTMQAGNLATSLRNEDVGEQQKALTAQDAINQFNTQTASGVQQRNTASQNQANQYNLDYEKNLEANRVNTANAQQQLNKDAYTTAMNARNDKIKAAINPTLALGQSQDQQFANRISGVQGIDAGVDQAAASIASGGLSDMFSSIMPKKTTATAGDTYNGSGSIA